MPFCENCGNKVSETTKFCSTCGFQLEDKEKKVDPLISKQKCEPIATKVNPQVTPLKKPQKMLIYLRLGSLLQKCNIVALIVVFTIICFYYYRFLFDFEFIQKIKLLEESLENGTWQYESFIIEQPDLLKNWNNMINIVYAAGWIMGLSISISVLIFIFGKRYSGEALVKFYDSFKIVAYIFLLLVWDSSTEMFYFTKKDGAPVILLLLLVFITLDFLSIKRIKRTIRENFLETERNYVTDESLINPKDSAGIR